jgi:hypothetical protein
MCRGITFVVNTYFVGDTRQPYVVNQFSEADGTFIQQFGEWDSPVGGIETDPSEEIMYIIFHWGINSTLCSFDIR